jgi:hypothetical protein
LALTKEIEGYKISHAWLGHYSCLFLELGNLTEGKPRKDGSTGNSFGEITVCLNFCWRIEKKKSIYIGTGESVKRLENAIKELINATIVSVQTIGRLSELQIEISNSLWLTTFERYSGQPSWSVHFKYPEEKIIEIKVCKPSVKNIS